jgi:Kef-type K+ transport system membrane component KefB
MSMLPAPIADLFPLSDPGAEFAVLLLLVFLGPLLASRLRLPGLLGLIVVGMVVGPNVLGIVSGSVLINALGFVGLLYLLFQGGLDLDLDGFSRRRRESIVFGVTTFVLPMIFVTAAALWLDVPFLAAVILASALTSHTPLSYPTITRFDLTRNRAVTATLGATLLATVAALLVLAVAAAAAEGGNSGFDWLLFGTGMVLFLAWMMGGVPRLTRWFFQGPGQDRDIRLTYLLSGMGFSAMLAGALGIEPIIGAFLAGLAFNRFVPAGTLISDRVEVLGRSLFIPAFLISTGMLLDPIALVADQRTLVLGAGLAAAGVVSKWGASSLSGRFFGFSAPERGVMFSLSVGQAAGALAAAIVGQEVGLLGEAEVNAIILVIMVSALLAGLSADRHAPRIEPPDSEGRALGTRVVVPVSNPTTIESLVRVAGHVAGPDSGAVVAVNVLPFDATPEQVRTHRELASRAEKAALATGSEVQTTVRIDASVDGGVLHSVVEQEGTCLVMGWEGGAVRRRDSLFGTVVDRCVAISPVPVLVCRPGVDERTKRILLIVTSDELTPAGERGLALAFDVAQRFARQAEASSVVITDLADEELRDRLDGRFDPDEVVTDDAVLRHLAGTVKEGDIVVAVAPPASSRLGRGAHRVAEAARDRTVVVAVPR